MHPEEDTLPTLTKWPFYLGDAILVVLALTIAFLDGWQLGGVQIFACVLAVALGAVLLVFPFVVEYQMFAREEKEDRAGEVRSFEKQLKDLESALLKQHERLKQLESRSGLDDQRYELLTSAIDQKMQSGLADLSALTERVGAIETSGKSETTTPDVFEKERVVLEESVQQAVESLDALQSRVETLEKRQKKKEASLLKRAIQEKQDTSSKAVSRIIDFESNSVSPDKEGEAETSGASKRKDAQAVSEGKTAQAEKPKEDRPAQEISSEIEELPDDFSVSLDAELMMDDDLFTAEPAIKPKKSTTKKAKKNAASKENADKAATEKSVTTNVEVNKLMGIGNKPFLRGSGAGLSWEKGVEMEFQEIGKWIWTARVSSNERVELQVYRNDKDADRKGKRILEAGQELEIIPEF